MEYDQIHKFGEELTLLGIKLTDDSQEAMTTALSVAKKCFAPGFYKVIRTFAAEDKLYKGVGKIVMAAFTVCECYQVLSKYR